MRKRFLLAFTASIACLSLAFGLNIIDFDENSQSSSLQRTEITIGEGNELARMPMDFYWKTSLYEVIYFASELPDTPMLITSIMFYNNFSSSDVFDKPMRIWLGNTRSSSLAQSWISASQLTPVFDGTVSFPFGQNTISIPLDTPFQYAATYNLVMMVQRPWDDDYYSMSDQFKAQSDNSLRARYVTSDSEQLDPSNPPAAANYGGQFPKTGFLMELSYDSTLSGIVTDEQGFGLSDVQISLNDGEFETHSNQYGYYEFTGMDPGEYVILLSLQDYVDIQESFTLDGVNDLVLDFVMYIKQESADETSPALQIPHLKVFPNPFSQSCSMSYELPKADRISISIYNLKGQLIRHLKDELQGSGTHTIHFDGKTASGQDMVAGIYLIKTQIGNQYQLSKLLKW